MAFIETFIETLKSYGIVETLVLVMATTIIYAILTKSQLFGNPDGKDPANRRANAVSMILAVIIGFLIFISPIGQQINLWFTKFFLHILVLLVFALGTFLLVGMAGGTFGSGIGFGIFGNSQKGKIATVIILVAIGFLVFVNAGGLELFGIQGTDKDIPGTSPLSIQWDPELVAEVMSIVLVFGLFAGTIALLYVAGKP